MPGLAAGLADFLGICKLATSDFIWDNDWQSEKSTEETQLGFSTAPVFLGRRNGHQHHETSGAQLLKLPLLC